MSAYPVSYDLFSVHVNATPTRREVISADDINAMAQAIAAIETELGLSPSAAYATLADRIDAIALVVGRATHVTFIQTSPITLWSISHNLGPCPPVTILDVNGAVVYADVSYPSPTQVIVEFTDPFAGRAELGS